MHITEHVIRPIRITSLPEAGHIMKPTGKIARLQVHCIVEPIRITSAAVIKNITRPTKTKLMLNKRNIVKQ